MNTAYVFIDLILLLGTCFVVCMMVHTFMKPDESLLLLVTIFYV